MDYVLPSAGFDIVGHGLFWPAADALPELKFDHNRTYSETPAYSRALTEAYPEITKVQIIGKSYLDSNMVQAKSDR